MLYWVSTLNPTTVSINQVTNQKTWTNPVLQVCNEPNKPSRWMNPTSMTWDLGGVMSEIQLQRGEPSPTILHFSNFEPCDLCFITSIMNLLYSLCNELWTILRLVNFSINFELWCYICVSSFVSFALLLIKLELECWIYTMHIVLNYV
jgi:hypothetical protein